eukprot:Nk52_evm57s914 gene=Nk52_evmTU57s914
MNTVNAEESVEHRRKGSSRNDVNDLIGMVAGFESLGRKSLDGKGQHRHKNSNSNVSPRLVRTARSSQDLEVEEDSRLRRRRPSASKLNRSLSARSLRRAQALGLIKRLPEQEGFEYPPFLLEVWNYGCVIVAWLLWPITAFIVGIIGGINVLLLLTTFFRIIVDLCIFAVLRMARFVIEHKWRRSDPTNVTHYEDWAKNQLLIEKLRGVDDWRRETCSDLYDEDLLMANLKSLRSAIQAKDMNNLSLHLKPCFNRHHCNLDDRNLHGISELGTKHIVEEYLDVVEKAIEAYCRIPDFDYTRSMRITALERGAKALGSTALCLSGGGSLAMYHVGVVKALLEANIMPKVIAGTSGGAIVALKLAIHTDAEMLDIVCKPDIADRAGKVFFESITSQVLHYFSSGSLINPSAFSETSRAYYGDFTFEEAYKRTGRIVNITVVKSDKLGHPVVLNYITAPRVLLWSALTATCAIPGLMPAITLMAKDKDGLIIPAYPEGVKWMDGSIMVDLPVSFLRRQFNCNQFIVSQVNPHVAPFAISKSNAPHSLQELENKITKDIRYRAKKLAKKKLMPNFFGQDLSGVVMQQYGSDTRDTVLIVPRLSMYDIFKVLSQPTYNDMKRYIHKGMLATWPRLAQIEHRLRLELKIEEELANLKGESEETIKGDQEFPPKRYSV